MPRDSNLEDSGLNLDLDFGIKDLEFGNWNLESNTMTKALYALLLIICSTVHAQTPRNLLSNFSPETVAASLIPKDQWKPFPKTPEEWKTAVPDGIREQIIAEALPLRDKPFKGISASRMLEFKVTGNRTNYEDESFGKREQLYTLMMAEAFEQKGRFINAVVDGIWSVCEESYWGIPAHLFLQKAGFGLVDVEEPSVDLFVSDTGTLMALCDYLLGHELDSISPLLRQRIAYEIDHRMITPMEKTSANYWYLQKGTKDAPVNNWNPWIISNWMTTLLLMEKNEQRRATELRHAMVLLDNYLNWQGEDGGIDEGPSYWSGAIGRLFDGLSILESASGGKLTIYQAPVVRQAAAYIYNVHIAEEYFINTADASPTINADGLLLYRIGRSLQDKTLTGFGAWVYHHLNANDKNAASKDFSKTRRMWNLMAMQACAAAPDIQPAVPDVWFASTQLMASRTTRGLFVATHGGHNAESHNHNDVGDFIVYASGKPVIVDAGMGTYTAQTFAKETRYTLWYNNSAHHNLPVINGIMQEAGSEYKANDVHYTRTKEGAQLAMDIAAAYPAEAGVQTWKRTVALSRKKNTVTVTDAYALKQPAKSLTQTFMTICDTDLSKPGSIVFTVPGSSSVTLTYAAAAWDVRREPMSYSAPDEKRLADNWGHRPMWRLLLVNKKPQATGTFTYTITQK
jgi:hypothetical protein